MFIYVFYTEVYARLHYQDYNFKTEVLIEDVSKNISARKDQIMIAVRSEHIEM